MNLKILKRIETSSEVTSKRVENDRFLHLLNCEVIIEAERRCLPNVNLEDAIVVELGSAGGATKSIRPHWIVSDIRSSTNIDVQFSATKIPFRSESVDLLFAQDVLHHIDDLELFASEVYRVLKPGCSAYFKEPYWGFIAQFVFRFLHPEMFSIRRLRPVSSFADAMDGNQALAYDLLRKKKSGISEIFSSFQFFEYGPKSGLAFALSGGATFTTGVSRDWLIKVHKIEVGTLGWLKIFGFSYSFSIKKTD